MALIRLEDTVTVQVFIFEDGKVLLVHKRPDEVVGAGEQDRPPGWEMPGGRVDRSAQESVQQIESFLMVFKLPKQGFFELPFDEEEFDIDVWLTAIREVLEETGVLIKPLKILFREQKTPDHYVVVIHAQLMGGTLQKRSGETDDAGWFEPSGLPEGTYFNHRRRIKKALMNIGNTKPQNVPVEIQEGVIP